MAYEDVENYSPATEEDFLEYMYSRIESDHSYDSAVEALAEITLTAFNYAAKELGVTGFQSSVADLLFFGKSRRIEGPFALVEARDMLYPQYNTQEKVEHLIESWRPWAAEKAKEKLEQNRKFAHPNVVKHWKKLAEYEE